MVLCTDMKQVRRFVRFRRRQGEVLAVLKACCLWVDSLHSASMRGRASSDLMPALQMLPTAAN